MNQHGRALASLALGLAIFAAAPGWGDVAPPPPPAPTDAMVVSLDSETTIAGVGVACTGIGGTKDDPKWLAYPVRLEFSNVQREYLIGATVTLADAKGATLFSATCPGPWLLLKLPNAAPYRVTATMSGGKSSAKPVTVKAPLKGQTRVILVFSGA